MQNFRPIRIAVADDHPVVLAGITVTLSDAEDIEVVFKADNVKSLLADVCNHQIDVLVCDFEFEHDVQADGIAMLRRLAQLAPQTKILLLSSHTATHIVSTALANGAVGFIGKSKQEFGMLSDAIRRVYRGEKYISSPLASALLATMFSPPPPCAGQNGSAPLSPREFEVVRLLCTGHSIVEISKRLHRSPKTISNQKNAAMRKLGARSDFELGQAARDLGLAL